MQVPGCLDPTEELDQVLRLDLGHAADPAAALILSNLSFIAT